MLRSAISLLSTIKATQSDAKSESRRGESEFNKPQGRPLSLVSSFWQEPGLCFRKKKTPTFQNTLFVRQALVNIEYAN